jgi:hypothetical protein
MQLVESASLDKPQEIRIARRHVLSIPSGTRADRQIWLGAIIVSRQRSAAP